MRSEFKTVRWPCPNVEAREQLNTLPDHEIDKTKPFGKDFQVPWLPGAEQRTHDPPEVVCHGGRKVTLLDFFQTAKPAPTSTTGVTEVRKRTFNTLGP